MDVHEAADEVKVTAAEPRIWWEALFVPRRAVAPALARGVRPALRRAEGSWPRAAARDAERDATHDATQGLLR